MKILPIFAHIPRHGDGGPIYIETNLDNFVVEPYNAVSAFLFILIVLYWFWKLRGEYNKHGFLLFNLPILLIGGVGGTLYHAFRSSMVYMYMDWTPIVGLALIMAGYYLFRVLKRWKQLLIIIGIAITLQIINFRVFSGLLDLYEPHIATSISYAIVAVLMLSSLVLLLIATRYKHSRYIGIALACFCTALFFRVIEFEFTPSIQSFMPMGTHFLWHLFGAAACHFILVYTYLLNETEVRPIKFRILRLWRQNIPRISARQKIDS